MRFTRGRFCLVFIGLIALMWTSASTLSGAALSQTDTLTISGRLIQGTANGQPIPPGLTVVLYVLDADGQLAATSQTTSDTDSAFTFTGVVRASGNVYLIQVDYADVPQGVQIAPIAGDETAITQDITLYERTTDRAMITITRANVLLNYAPMSEYGLEVWLWLEMVNNGDQIVTSAETAGPNNWFVSAQLELPVGSFGIQPTQSENSQRYVVEIVNEVPVVKDTWPLRPGESHEITVAYYLPYDGNLTIKHRFSDRVADAVILVPNDTVGFASDQFDPVGEWRYRAQNGGIQITELPADAAIDPTTDFALVKEHSLLEALPPDTPMVFSLTGMPTHISEAEMTVPAITEINVLPPSLTDGLLMFVSDQTNNQEIYVMGLDGRPPHRLTNEPTPDICPHWSPDGEQIVFISERSGNQEIYVMTRSGRDIKRLTNTSAVEWSPAWSPNGKEIAFSSDLAGNMDIYVMQVDGSNVHPLTTDPTDDWNPAWSPDGRRIVFETNRDGNSEIYVMNADGTEPHNLTNHPADEWLPTWSPDGTHIAFVSMRDGNPEIYIMNADGSEPRNLTNLPTAEYYPTWSPDGNWLAFISTREGSTAIYIMTLDGSVLYRLVDGDADYSWLTWQPRALGDMEGQNLPG